MTATRSRVLRPPGLVVFAVLFALLVVGWWLFADSAVQRGVEATGQSIVGARVELASVDLRPAEGLVRLEGLQVANPDAPMTNLLEAEEIIVDLLVEPLLSKKVVVENLVVTGVRFNTPRETSGALENPDPEAGALWRSVNEWADQIEIPTLSLENLRGVVNIEALDADSLKTVQHGRALVARTDSLRTEWEARLAALDPRPRLDSLSTVVNRLEAFRPTPLNALQLPGLVRDGRRALDDLTGLRSEIASLDDVVREQITALRGEAAVFAELRAEDFAYARRLLNIPSLEAPSISPAMFGGTALVWLKPVLFWAQTAERFLPPGLDPRNRPGPQRARAKGTTVQFPGRAEYPAFLMQQGQVELEIGGSGAAAGDYTAVVRNLTSAPTLLGRPMEIQVGRQEGAVGPSGLTLGAVIDHAGEVIRDSVALTLSGVNLPELNLDAFGGRIGLGEGDTQFNLSRIGNEIRAQMRWVSTDLSWTGADGRVLAAGGQTDLPGFQIGSADWARDLIWRAITGVERVELTMGLNGAISSPSLSISSNLGQAVATSLQRELGREIDAAEAQVRAEVDRQIQPLIQNARGRVDAAQVEIADRVGLQREEVEQLRARLEERIAQLVPGPRRQARSH